MAQVDERTKLMSEFLEPLPEGVQPGPSNLIFGLHIGAKTLQSYWEAFKKADDERKQTALVKQQLRTELLGKKAQTISAVADIYQMLQEREYLKEKREREEEDYKWKLQHRQEEWDLYKKQKEAEIKRSQAETQYTLTMKGKQGTEPKPMPGKIQADMQKLYEGTPILNILLKNTVQKTSGMAPIGSSGIYVNTTAEGANLINALNGMGSIAEMKANREIVANEFYEMLRVSKPEKSKERKRIEENKDLIQNWTLRNIIDPHITNLNMVYETYANYNRADELTFDKGEIEKGERKKYIQQQVFGKGTEQDPKTFAEEFSRTELKDYLHSIPDYTWVVVDGQKMIKIGGNLFNEREYEDFKRKKMKKTSLRSPKEGEFTTPTFASSE